MEKVPQVISGKWIWKEDAASLEFIPCASQMIDSKDKKTRRKTLTVNEQNNRQDRVTPNWLTTKALPATGITAPSKTQKHEVRPAKSAKEKETVVTLERVKVVTLSFLHEVNVNTETFEDALFELEQFDEFLYGLLNYFAAFFDKLALSKPKQAMSSEPSQAELRAKAEVESSLTNSRKRLAQSYSILLLGIGLPENHHMGCGGQRLSSTHRDRAIYETLYQFCVAFVWIAFYRKEQELISQEVGRLLRSDVFNPALRVKQSITEDSGRKKLKDNMAPSEKPMKKRPAITSIINKRSPVIVSLLPTPKERSGWLFDRLDPSVAPKEDGAEKSTPLKRNVGIIGEPLHLFNPTTLALLDSEQEEESTTEDEANKDGFETSIPHPSFLKSVFTQVVHRIEENRGSMSGVPANNGPSAGRQMTAQSQTTDVFTDDDEQ